MHRTHRCAVLPALLLAMTLAAPLAAQVGVPVVTLHEARQRAAAVDPGVVAARGDVGSTAWERRAARLDMLVPNFLAQANYTKYNNPFFSFTGRPSTTVSTATLQASYTILGYGKLSELRRSGASVETAEANATAAGFRSALSTDAAYYGALAATDLLRVANDQLRRAQEQFGVARVRVQAGETIATDSLQLLLELNRARFAVVQRDSALAVARFRLGRLIGLAGPVDAAPLDTAPPQVLPLTLEQATVELRERGPELEAARAAERQAEANLSSQRAQYFPALTIGAQWAAYDETFFPTYLERSSLSLALTFPIWDGGRREVTISRARADRDVAQAERADRERAAGEAMAEAWHGYQTAKAGVELAVVGVQASAETFRVQTARYREGATTILDLVTAQVNLGEAEAGLVQARYQARLSLARIEALLGRRLFPETR